MDDALTGQTVELLQQMIRNQCVNDGSVTSGYEGRTTDLLRAYLGQSGLDVEVYEPDGAPGRRSLVARIEGTDPAAPTLCLMGHTDVVPVTPEHWTRDPFGGELVNGEVWGRGAVDMLNLTASQAGALKTLARKGWRPRGTLVYLACADEEAGGVHGAGHVCKRHWDALRADYLLTENGGLVSSHGSETNVTVHVGEKGVAWRRLRLTGTPGHGSMPYGADNALVKAAHVVSRLADYRPAPYVDELWQGFVDTLGADPAMKEALRDPARVDDAIAKLPKNVARFAWSATHTTFSPNICRAGVKTNPTWSTSRWTSAPSPATTRTRCAATSTKLSAISRKRSQSRSSTPSRPRPPPRHAPLECAREGGGRALPRGEAPAAHDRGLHRRALLPRARGDGLWLRALLTRPHRGCHGGP